MRVFVTGIGIVSPLGIGRKSFWEAVVPVLKSEDVRHSRPWLCEFGRMTEDRRLANLGSAVCAQPSPPPSPRCEAALHIARSEACRPQGGARSGRRPVRTLAGFELESIMPGVDSRRMSRVAQFACAAAHLALSDGGVSDKAFIRDLALCTATTHGACEYSVQFHDGMFDYGPGKTSAMLFSSSTYNAALSAVAITFGIGGPSLSLAGGPECGLDAIGLASELLRSGAARAALAGGTEELTDVHQAVYERSELLRDMTLTEGACFVLLETEDSVRSRSVAPLCEIAAYDTGTVAWGRDISRADSGPSRERERAVSHAGSDPSRERGRAVSHADSDPSPERERAARAAPEILPVRDDHQKETGSGELGENTRRLVDLLGEGFAFTSAAAVVVALCQVEKGSLAAGKAKEREQVQNMALNEYGSQPSAGESAMTGPHWRFPKALLSKAWLSLGPAGHSISIRGMTGRWARIELRTKW